MNEVIVSVPHGPGVVAAGAKHSRAWWRLAVVAVVGALVLSFNWGSRLLLTNDDTRFPVLVRDVLVNGHWLLPAFPDGTFHLVKPPLAVWLIAIASWPTGSVSVRTAVLPSLLAAIGAVLLTYWLGCRLLGPDPGAVGGLAVTTMVGVYTMAHSSMPDMVQLVFGTGAIAAYVATGFAANRAWLVLFYGLIGLGSLAKGIAGFVPLAVVIGDTIIAHGAVGLRRLVSIPGWVVLVGLAVPWWIVAAASAGHNRFVHGFVFNDQLLSYFVRHRWDRQAIAEPISFAVTVLLPWGLLLPFAIRRALREADPDTVRRVRLLGQTARTVLPSALSARSAPHRVVVFDLGVAGTRSSVRRRVDRGRGGWRRRRQARYAALQCNEDLRAVRAVLSEAPAPLYSLDLQDLALSFNLDRPVVNVKTLQRFEDRVRQGEMGYLIIWDRDLATKPRDPCMRSIARGLVTRQPFTVLDPAGCGWRPLSSGDRRAG